ncbi:MAG: ShlB/FhaC/HecB family hemolysin secretion/activation protein, partial [Stenotrophobium sp.]
MNFGKYFFLTRNPILYWGIVSTGCENWHAKYFAVRGKFMRLLTLRIQRIVFFTAVAHCGLAWTAPAAPTPGQVEGTLKNTPVLQAPPPPPITRPQQQQAPAPTTENKIVVRRFEFFGNTVYDSATLSELVTSYLNRPLSLKDIYAAADVVTRYYIKHGYTLASVNLPPQKVTEGVVRLAVIEGHIDLIFIEGNKSYKTAHIQQVLGDVKSGGLYRGDALYDGVHRLNELPGLQAKAVIEPGDEEGTSNIFIKTTEHRIEGSVTEDNYGRTDVGEFRTSAFAQLNNPLGLDDRLQLLGLRAQGGLLSYYHVGYSAAVNADKTRLNLSYGHANFRTDALPVNGKNDSGEANIEQTLFDTHQSKATVFAGAIRTVANSTISGLPLSDTLITVFEVGGTYYRAYDNQAVTQVMANIHTNFQKQDQAALSSGLTVHGNELFRLEVDAQQLLPIYGRLSVLGHIDAVYSPDALVDTEKFTLGGPQSVRGYQPSQALGDRGYLASISLIQPFGIGPINFNGRVFTDWGSVSNIAPLGGGSASIGSAGIGLDAQYRALSAKVDWSIPFDDHG